MAVEDINSAARNYIAAPTDEAESTSSPQNTNLQGHKVTVRSGGLSLALLMEETIEVASSPINSKVMKYTNKKKKLSTRKKDSEDEHEEELEKQPVKKIKTITQINKTKDQTEKGKDPFLAYRDLKDERDKLIQETPSEKRKKIQAKLDGLNAQMAKLYSENANLIDSGLVIDPAVQAAVADFKDKSIDISEQDIYQNYRDINAGYKDAILDYGTVRETYNKIIETYTEEYFEDGLRTLTSALSKDLMRFNTQIKGGLTDKTQLSLIAQDLYKLRSLHSFYLNCSELLQGFTTESISMGSFIHKFLELLEKNWVEATDVEELTKLISESPKSKKVLSFLNRMLLAVKSVPTDNAYSTGTEGPNTELLDAISILQEEKAVAENMQPIIRSKI